MKNPAKKTVPPLPGKPPQVKKLTPAVPHKTAPIAKGGNKMGQPTTAGPKGSTFLPMGMKVQSAKGPNPPGSGQGSVNKALKTSVKYAK